MYIASGNTYKLLDVVRKSGFSNFITQVVSEKIIIGNSAGAVILGQDISSSNDENIIGLKNTEGLRLVDYLVCPHYSVDKDERLQNLSRNFNQKVIGISERSAILIDSNKEEKFGDIKVFEP
ncbi:Type 1 glutamine amidotransferase-like domain-containing protein [Anaeromonas gelatinilytica]|uniref:Type 1 glutamine amidotransferase-like domain-containing protein n=1 Tax=Anaeromonas gelatinilytica TaxID=2683194 RepID=UPI0033147D31